MTIKMTIKTAIKMVFPIIPRFKNNKAEKPF